MLFPAGKPKFFSLSSSFISGCAARIRETESLVEPLSTTITVRFGYVQRFNELRHPIVSFQPFQFTMMQTTCGYEPVFSGSSLYICTFSHSPDQSIPCSN